MELKAYHVQEDYEASCCIVFETNSASARRHGAAELGVEWEDVEFCRRAPWADQYAGRRGGVPHKAMIEQGWRVSCGGCGRWISQDDIDDQEDCSGEPMAPVAIGGWIYCTATCHDSEVAELKERQNTEIATRQEAVAKFPGCEVLNYHVIACTPKPDKPTVVLAIPGLKDTATWHRGEDCVYVAREDVEAMKRYREKRREAAA